MGVGVILGLTRTAGLLRCHGVGRPFRQLGWYLMVRTVAIVLERANVTLRGAEYSMSERSLASAMPGLPVGLPAVYESIHERKKHS